VDQHVSGSGLHGDRSNLAKVFAELVIRVGSGRINGVRYDELVPLLLNETQQQ
jgi:hypothetical protein